MFTPKHMRNLYGVYAQLGKLTVHGNHLPPTSSTSTSGIYLVPLQPMGRSLDHTAKRRCKAGSRHHTLGWPEKRLKSGQWTGNGAVGTILQFEEIGNTTMITSVYF